MSTNTSTSTEEENLKVTFLGEEKLEVPLTSPPQALGPLVMLLSTDYTGSAILRLYICASSGVWMQGHTWSYIGQIQPLSHPKKVCLHWPRAASMGGWGGWEEGHLRVDGVRENWGEGPVAGPGLGGERDQRLALRVDPNPLPEQQIASLDMNSSLQWFGHYQG